MSNLEFLEFLRKRGILHVESIIGERKYVVWDSEGWNCAAVRFDEKGDVVNDRRAL